MARVTNAVRRRRVRVLGFALALLLALWTLAILLGCPLRGERAEKNVVPTCTLPVQPSATWHPDAHVDGGSFTAETAIIPAGTTLILRRSFTLVTEGDLIVNGALHLESPIGSRAVALTLVSRKGSVIVGESATIDGVTPHALFSRSTSHLARVRGRAGVKGATVRLSGVRVIVRGTIAGVGGGRGEAVEARGCAAGPVGGGAAAGGGEGGAGGDVLLCARDAIDIAGGALIAAGDGGDGGAAAAFAVNGSRAFARAGDGTDGGSVYFAGMGATLCSIVIAPTARVIAGHGGSGGVLYGIFSAVAMGGVGRLRKGGDATAIGGNGGDGGTVLFRRCTVRAVDSRRVQANSGGDGGDAEATGGSGGGSSLWAGSRGGCAFARGGTGGRPGALPRIPLIAGAARGGRAAAEMPRGSGGAARATPGGGGRGGRWGHGGSSGAGWAQAGGARSGAPPPRVQVQAVRGFPSTRGDGGVPRSAWASGPP
jgi:hypothetical protein